MSKDDDKKAERLLRLKSLIDRDLQSVRSTSETAEQVSTQHQAANALRQRRGQLEAEDLALREEAQKQREQRQQHHRQHMLAGQARRVALKEQKQKQTVLRAQKEQQERKQVRSQMRSTVTSPHETFDVSAARNEKNAEHVEGDVLQLTRPVIRGVPPQGIAARGIVATARRDARLYSPFSHTQSFFTGSRKSRVRSLGAALFGFLLAPFLLLGRSVLWPYRMLRSLAVAGIDWSKLGSNRQRTTGGARAGISVLRACWHFATAPLHLLAHAVLDPFGMFTRLPHNYPRMSPLVYGQIFVQQTKRSCLVLLRGLRRSTQACGQFFVAPFLLLASVMLAPWRSVRYGRLSNLAVMLADNGAALWRKTRIRSLGLSQSFGLKAMAAFRGQGASARISIRKSARDTARRGWRGVQRNIAQLLPALKRSWRTSTTGLQAVRERLTRHVAVRLQRGRQPSWEKKIAAARAVTSSHALSFEQDERHDEVMPLPRGLAQEPDKRSNDSLEARAEKRQPQRQPQRQLLADREEKTGLFADSAPSVLEDFFASGEDAAQSDEVVNAFLQSSHKDDEKAQEHTPKNKQEHAQEGGEQRRKQEGAEGKLSDVRTDKDTVYREMDNLRSALEEGGGSATPASFVPSSVSSLQASASDEEKVFDDIEGLDERAREKLLQRLSRRVEEEKLR